MCRKVPVIPALFYQGRGFGSRPGKCVPATFQVDPGCMLLDAPEFLVLRLPAREVEDMAMGTLG